MQKSCFLIDDFLYSLLRNQNSQLISSEECCIWGELSDMLKYSGMALASLVQ